MDSGVMEAAMAGEESSGSWNSSTNWIAAEGSLQDSISFETSDESAPALTSSGVLLVRPPSDDPPPCEVTSKSNISPCIWFLDIGWDYIVVDEMEGFFALIDESSIGFFFFRILVKIPNCWRRLWILFSWCDRWMWLLVRISWFWTACKLD